jgi:carboxypeptidase T
VAGRSYVVQQSVGLYPTSATSDDYAFSRHLVDDGSGRNRGKVFGYTVEFGQEFVPPYAEMRQIIDEVGAALTELCLAASEDLQVDITSKSQADPLNSAETDGDGTAEGATGS